MINIRYILPIVTIFLGFNHINPLITKISGSDNYTSINQNFKNLMWAAQNGIGARVQLENELLNRDFGINSIFGDMVMSAVLVDTIPEKVDTILNYVLQNGTINERIITNTLFVEKERYTDAQANLTEVSFLNETGSQQINDFIQLQQLQIQLNQTPDTMVKALIQQNESWISEIASNQLHFCQSSGLSLLEQLYDTTFAREIDIGDDNSERYSQLKPEEPANETGCTFYINPNPAGSSISVILNPEEITGEETISIYNSEGKKVKFIYTDKGKGLYLIDVNNIIKGNYIVDIENKGVILCAQKLIIY